MGWWLRRWSAGCAVALAVLAQVGCGSSSPASSTPANTTQTSSGGSTAGGTRTLSFSQDIAPVALTSCACHGADWANLAVLTQRGLVVPGDSPHSAYYTTGVGGGGHPAGNCWASRGDVVATWITQGAKP